MQSLHRNLQVLFLAAFALFVLAACKTTPVITPESYLDALMADTGQDGEACIDARDINDYRSLNTSSVVSIGTTPSTKEYIAVTRFRCNGLSTSSKATFRSNKKELCGSGRDAFLVPQYRCTIEGIFEFENRSAALAAWDRVNASLREDSDAPAAQEGAIASTMP